MQPVRLLVQQAESGLWSIETVASGQGAVPLGGTPAVQLPLLVLQQSPGNSQ